MDRTFVRACALLLSVFAIAISVNASDRSKREDAVRAADQEWARVFAAKQLDASVAMCAADARVLAPNFPVAKGHDSIRELFAGFFALPDLKINWRPDEARVAGSGDLAYTTGRYEMSFAGPDGKLIKDHGKYVTVWQKQSGGTWKVLVDGFNTDIPLMPPASQ